RPTTFTPTEASVRAELGDQVLDARSHVAGRGYLAFHGDDQVGGRAQRGGRLGRGQVGAAARGVETLAQCGVGGGGRSGHQLVVAAADRGAGTQYGEPTLD